MRYASAAPGRASATITLVAASDHLDLRLHLDPDFTRPVAEILFPADVTADVTAAQSVYTPTFLPGIRLLPGSSPPPGGTSSATRHAGPFADFEAADMGRSHIAIYSVNPAPSSLAPVDVGVIHDADGSCGGGWFCLTHAFQTWLTAGEAWTSPVVRVRVGGSAETSVLAYRADNGIDRYPSLAEKLGTRLDTLARAPLVKADPWNGLPRFADWGPALRKLPSPSLLHPVAFQPGGHDEDYPDFLPPDPKWGTTAELNAALDVLGGNWSGVTVAGAHGSTVY
jgi:hypothetical protein